MREMWILGMSPSSYCIDGSYGRNASMSWQAESDEYRSKMFKISADS